MPEFVEIFEMGPRDGLQNEARPVSAADKIALVHALQAAGLHRQTHRIFISSQTGAVKPNPSAYVQILEQASPGDNLLYVDDKEVNVEAFRRLGVDGVQADTSGSWTAAVDGWLAASTGRTW